MNSVRETSLYIKLDQISKTFSDRLILDGITLEIFSNESIAIIGPNGSGKSTLLRLITGLIPVTKGTREVAIERLKIGYVPDRFPKLRFTPREYLLDMGRIKKIPISVLHTRIQTLLNSFTMDFATDQRMTGFSKGMLQKVNLMQALLDEPDLLVLDEPLSGLDQDSQQELISLLAELKRKGITLVTVCHESLVLETIVDRVITVGDGKIVEDNFAHTNKPTDVVVIQAILKQTSHEDEIGHHTGIFQVETRNGMTTLHVDAPTSNDVLRTLLQMDATVLSLNPVLAEEDRLHFRKGKMLQREGTCGV